jgi:hypothetical protein
VRKAAPTHVEAANSQGRDREILLLEERQRIEEEVRVRTQRGQESTRLVAAWMDGVRCDLSHDGHPSCNWCHRLLVHSLVATLSGTRTTEHTRSDLLPATH